MKFGRLFQMAVEGRSGDTHLIQSPLTVRFRVNNNCLFSSGTAVFQLTNLTEDVRNDLYHDAYQFNIYQHIEFGAGYQADSNSPGAINIPIIFKGNVITAFSYRQGPDWVTEITALDGGFAIDNGVINVTKPTPWSYRDMLSDAVRAMPRTTLGLIGAFDIANSRGITFCGNPWDLIVQSAAQMNGQAFISGEKVYILQQWEYIDDEGQLETISEETGLIGTPRSQDGLVRVRMLFEPRLEPGQQVNLQTPSIPKAILRNGFFKVLELVHVGTVSGAVCESAETLATLYQPDRALAAV